MNASFRYQLRAVKWLYKEQTLSTLNYRFILKLMLDSNVNKRITTLLYKYFQMIK
jgi:hypothetical protein